VEHGKTPSRNGEEGGQTEVKKKESKLTGEDQNRGLKKGEKRGKYLDR